MPRSKLYKSLTQHQPQGHWDTVIIGSGISAMACGAALSKTGQRVLLLEQHYIPGGMTHSFSRKGFRWDVGIHVIGEQTLEDVPGKLLAWLTDSRLEMNRLPETYERFWYPDGYEFTFSSNGDNFRAKLVDAFPHEKKGIDKYFRLMSIVFNVARPYYVLKATPISFNRLCTATIGRIWRRYWGKTTTEVMDSLFSDPKLKTILTSQWGYYGSPPSRSSFGMHAMLATHFTGGAYYPVGGSESFAKYLLDTIDQAGGETYVRASVDRILIENNRAIGVELSTGQQIFADRVVSSAGTRNTIHHLLPPAHRSSTWAKELGGITSAPAYFCLNLGFEGNIRDAGASETNNWLMESWDNENAFWDVLDPDSVPPISYVSFPSLKDPELRQESLTRNTGEALAFVHWDTFSQWRDTRWGHRPDDYLQLKANIESRLVKHLKNRLPQIMKHMVYHEMSTPLSANHFSRTWNGGIYGLETTPARFANPYLSTRTPIKGLYMTGSDIVTPGITGALVAGVFAAIAIKPRIFARMI